MFCFAPNHQLYFPFLIWGSYWVSLTRKLFLLAMSFISFNYCTLCYPRLSILLCGNKVLSVSFTFMHQPFIFFFRFHLLYFYSFFQFFCGTRRPLCKSQHIFRWIGWITNWVWLDFISIGTMIASWYYTSRNDHWISFDDVVISQSSIRMWIFVTHSLSHTLSLFLILLYTQLWMLKVFVGINACNCHSSLLVYIIVLSKSHIAALGFGCYHSKFISWIWLADGVKLVAETVAEIIETKIKLIILIP